MDANRYEVVINDEEQYSIWEAGSPPPAGWDTVGVGGTKEECLAHVDRVWTDMRPRSLRLAMDGAAADDVADGAVDDVVDDAVDDVAGRRG